MDDDNAVRLLIVANKVEPQKSLLDYPIGFFSFVLQQNTMQTPTINANVFVNMQLQSQGLQLLESLFIIETTAKLDTLNRRYHFIEQIYPNMEAASTHHQYAKTASLAVDKYKLNYADRTVNPAHAELLLTPNIESIKQYMASCIFTCFERHAVIEDEQISKLTKTAAIKNRTDKLIRTGYDAKYMFKSFELPDHGQLEAIENIRKQYYKRF